MSDISTENLDAGGDSPKLARADILEAVRRVNELTRSIVTSTPEVVFVDNNLSVTGDSDVDGKLTVQGSLTLGTGGTAGQLLASTGPGLPMALVDAPVSGDKFKSASTTQLTLDATSPKNLVVDHGLAFTPGQAIVLANDSTHYFSGTVQTYDPATGNLAFINEAQVGSGTFAAWTVNVNGAKDLPGTNGTNGATWYNGSGAPAVGLGANNDYYLDNTNGDNYQKQTGAWVKIGNLTGPAGSGSGGGSSIIYNPTVRYFAVTAANQTVQIVSSSTVKTGISWTRTGTSMTFTDAAHGHSVGERAIARNVNVVQVDGIISAVTTNTFTIPCDDSGPTSGTTGAYSMGFTVSYTGAVPAITGVVVTAPIGCDCTLVSMRVHLAANTRSAVTLNLTMPKGSTNGNAYTSNDNMLVPFQQVRQDVQGLTAVGNTFSGQITGDFAIFQFAVLPAVTIGIHILMTF